MRKFLTVLIIGLISLFSMVAGGINEAPGLIYTGVAIGILLALSIIIWIFRTVARFIGNQLTSYCTVFLASIIILLFSWHGVVSSWFAVISGIILGGLHLFFLMRWLGKKSEKSLLIGEVFSVATNYHLSNFIKVSEREVTVESKEDLEEEHNDKKNIIAVLKELGYKTKEAREAADYAIEQTNVHAPLDDKVLVAIKYFGSGVKS